MNKVNLATFLTPATFTTIWTYMVLLIERKKKQVNSEEYYEELKREVVETYKESIDQSDPQPLVHLIKTKRYDLDPELRKRLQILEEWKRDSLWTFANNFGSACIPSLFGMVLFPRSTAWMMSGIATLIYINYLNEKQVLSGGKYKSYFVKDVLPKQDQMIQGFKYISSGLVSLALLKIGLYKFTKARKQKIINDWRKNLKKK